MLSKKKSSSNISDTFIKAPSIGAFGIALPIVSREISIQSTTNTAILVILKLWTFEISTHPSSCELSHDILVVGLSLFVILSVKARAGSITNT